MLCEPKPQMRRAWGINRPGSFESELLWTEMLEEANAITKKNRDQMNLHLVQQTRPDVLLADVRATHDGDDRVPGGRLRLPQGALDSAGHEGVHPSGFSSSSSCETTNTGSRAWPVGSSAPHHATEVS